MLLAWADWRGSQRAAERRRRPLIQQVRSRFTRKKCVHVLLYVRIHVCTSPSVLRKYQDFPAPMRQATFSPTKLIPSFPSIFSAQPFSAQSTHTQACVAGTPLAVHLTVSRTSIPPKVEPPANLAPQEVGSASIPPNLEEQKEATRFPQQQ